MAKTISGLNKKEQIITDPNYAAPPRLIDKNGVNVAPTLPSVAPTGTTNTSDPKIEVPADKILRDQSGNIQGIIQNGNIKFRNPAEVERLAQQQLLNKGGTATNQLEAQLNQQATSQQMQQQIEANAGLIDQVGNSPMGNQPQATDFSQSKAAFAATAGSIPTILRNVGAAAGAGALGGSVIPGVGTAVGAVALGGLALVASVYQGAISSFKSQAGDVISSQNKVLSSGKQNLKKYVALIKADPVNADKYLQGYQQQKARIAEAHSKLKLDTERDSFKFLSKDGSLVLQSYDDFYSDGGYAQILDTNMQLALLGKNPDLADLMALDASLQQEENQQ
jgi:hypothetical protein